MDFDERIVRLGALVDLSGPGAAIGRPYADGVRLAVARANAPGSGLLPEGWRVELIERDHAYNPQRAVQAYNEIRDRVFFFAVSFGTPNTLPLQPLLERDGIVAFPASLSSAMARHTYTPPVAPTYRVEAMRAFDWAIQDAGGTANVRPAIVYQQDDYGQDGLDGWREAARYHGVSIVAEQAIAPGQTDMTAVISRLREAGANYVLLTVLPSSTAPILGTAAQLGYEPVWIGQAPSWVDRFFDPSVVPPAVFARFHWVTGRPFWGEEVPGMQEFLDAHQRFRGKEAQPDSYMLNSYIPTLLGLEVLGRTLASGQPTRERFLAELRSVKGWNAGGLIQPIDLTRFPYVTGTRTRVLRPDMAERTWTVVADWAQPAALAEPR